MAPRYLLLLLSAVIAGLPGLSGQADSSEEVSIESAKREFGNWHEPSELTPADRLKLPSINSSQLQRPDGNAPVPLTTRRQTLREKQQQERDENWLLEAMLEQPEDAEEVDSLKKEQEALTADPFEQMIAEQLNQSKQQEEEETRRAEAEELESQVVNPLTEFMSGWVSERDRDLLIPDGPKHEAAGWINHAAQIAPGRTLTAPASFQDFSSSRSGFEVDGGGGPANPYLEFSTPVFEEPVQSVVPQNFTSPQGDPPVRSTFEPAPATRSVLPAEPPMNRNEESKKYFPQLKRF